MSESPLVVEINPRQLEHARKILERYRDRSLMERLGRGTLATARLLVPAVRSAAPVGPTRRTRTTVRAAKARRGTGAILGSRSYSRHWTIRGHRIVTPGGTDTGKRTTPNPFVDAAVAPRIDAALRHVSDVLFSK